MIEYLKQDLTNWVQNTFNLHKILIFNKVPQNIKNMIFCLFSSFRNLILILALGTNENSQNLHIDGELIKLFGLIQGTDISSEE